MVLKAGATAGPASWIVGSDEPWHDLTSFGPPGFESYARLRFMPDPEDVVDPHSESDDDLTDQAKVARLCELLSSATTTPDDCYFAIWDGWPHKSPIMHRSARMHIPNRSYYLLHGPLTDFGQWGVQETGYNAAAFVWPADHAWCVASDVDDHWAGIGADAGTIARLVAHTDLDIVTADPHRGTCARYAAPARYFRGH